MLPDGSGLELMTRMRAVRPVKGIALTGFGTAADIEKSIDAGFDKHLTKPITLDQLVQAIAQLFL